MQLMFSESCCWEIPNLSSASFLLVYGEISRAHFGQIFIKKSKIERW